MRRDGVTYEDVDRAAKALLLKGVNVTVDSVSANLGRGSRSTITPLVRQWKENNRTTSEIAHPAQALGIPEELLSAVKSVVDSMRAHAEVALKAAQEQHAEQMAEAEAKIQDQVRSLEASEQGRLDLQSRVDLLDAEKLALSRILAEKQVLIDQAAIEREGLNQRLIDRASENDRLADQLTQTRTQFNHYQEAVAEQRAQDQRAYHQNIERVTYEMQTAQRQVAAQQEQIGRQEAEINHLSDGNQKLTKDVSALRVKLSTTLKESDRSAERARLLAQERDTLSEKLAAAEGVIQDLRLQLAISQERLTTLRDQVERDADKAVQLNQENLQLLQSKAALEARVEEMEKKAAGNGSHI